MSKKIIFGLIYDDKTGKVTYYDGEAPAVGADFTFENQEGVNPLQYATQKTAEKLVEILKVELPKDIKYTIARLTYVQSLTIPPISITVERNGIKEQFSAGLIANSLIRSGSLESFKHDLKIAGILF